MAIRDEKKVLIADHEEFIMGQEEELDYEMLNEFIQKHKALVTSRYEILKDYYEGKHRILQQSQKEEFKPDNRVVVNFPKYLIDTFEGYLMGVPVRITHDDDSINEYITNLSDFNNLEDVLYEIKKNTLQYGIGYGLVFMDEESQVNIVELSPMDTFVIKDDSIRKKPKYGVNYHLREDNTIVGTYSDNEKVYYFEEGDDGLKNAEAPISHYFGDVPIIEFVENKEYQALWEPAQTLIDQYNKVISEKSNDVDYFADAYIKIIGMELKQQQLADLRDMRVINLYNQNPDLDFKGDVEFLAKPSADETQENLLAKLEEKIYQITMVSNISNESFGSSAGISLAYKLQAMDNLSRNSETKFKAGLKKMFKLINNVPSTYSDGEWQNIDFKFTRNIPKNVLEETQVINNLNGIVSRETQLSYLSIVDDPKLEMERAKSEQDDGELWEEEGMLGRRKVDYESTGIEPILEEPAVRENRENQI